MIRARLYAAVGAFSLVLLFYPSLSDYRTAANKIIATASDWSVPDALQKQWDVGGLRKVKTDLIKRHPELTAMPPRQLVLALREIAYRTIKVGVTGGNLNDIWTAYEEAAVTRTAEHSCQGINIIYRIMLTAFGIASREVDFYGDNEVSLSEILYSHATTDVVIDGRWEASDATFNLSLRDTNGERISWTKAYDLIRHADGFEFNGDGLVHLKNRTPDDAKLAIGKAMIFMVVAGDKIRTEPKEWNGEIDLTGRIRLDMAKSDSHPMYSRLSNALVETTPRLPD